MENVKFYQAPPAFDQEWLEHEKISGILSQAPITDLKARQIAFSKRRTDLNKMLLSDSHKHLAEGIHVHNITVDSTDPQDIHPIHIRVYDPISSSETPKKAPSEGQRLVIYYHGGGLRVGDLDCEDISCRKICKELSVTVCSVDYRLMPDFTADQAVTDAIDAFGAIVQAWKPSRLVVVGSSSGGQLAATVAQAKVGATSYGRIHGILLRCPVTSEPTAIPEKFQKIHTSMSSAFNSSLAGLPGVVTQLNRAQTLPLEFQDLSRQPRTWMQVTTNDIYYSDGVCYAKALHDAGVEIKIDVVQGWPHTFWLDAPLLKRAIQADGDMIVGLKWLFDSN
ncbi:Alpha/Beta hydrolase protein [Xylogone sp. PMI_703]|nr:Alpha/Beta hydrolase protein [Xylogone sp. PMI_703]